MNLQTLITRREGDVPHAYQDHKGYWTIGVGHMVDRRLGGGLHPEVRQLQLKLDLEDVEEELDVHLPWWRHESKIRQMVLVDMCFNMGLPRLLGFQNMLAAWEAGDYDKAALELLDSEYAREFKRLGNPRAEQNAHMVKFDELPQELTR